MYKHKLFKADIFLVLITVFGLVYLYNKHTVSINYGFVILIIYILSKIIGYILLPYNKFEIFLNYLTASSKLSILSGFEIFKTILVLLLYVGFIFIDPSYWIVESVLVVAMRIWGIAYIKNNNKR